MQKKQWFTATVDLANPSGTDGEGRFQWKMDYERVGGRPKEKVQPSGRAETQMLG